MSVAHFLSGRCLEALASMMKNPQALAGGMQAKEEKTQAAVERATRGMPAPRIKDLKLIEVGEGGVNDSTIVKVTTDQAGLYGYGRATATFAENFEVKFAWHGAPNSPVGRMTNLTLDLTHGNFGYHEHIDLSPVGTTELHSFSRPYGTLVTCFAAVPALKCRAIFNASLRDVHPNGRAFSSLTARGGGLP
jgi:hypothetical protein